MSETERDQEKPERECILHPVKLQGIVAVCQRIFAIEQLAQLWYGEFSASYEKLTNQPKGLSPNLNNRNRRADARQRLAESGNQAHRR
ncbi:MAG TPA: hypothetical protein VL361_07670 [Candidatus Limnocylindrales bacterium]|jgi:hypothetical protein|nr:hypothetical protein [Candidatus Limnocylindrales bacterium]